MEINKENSPKGSVFFKANAYELLSNFLEQENPSKIFVLVDSHTHEFCLNKFLQKTTNLQNAEIIEIEPGEENKNLETCNGIWQALSELGADRKSLMINLGGGVITDIGGFAASTFMRGIKYINVPTTLLSMVDASIGGKTGIDLGNKKNQIGVINTSEFVVIDTDFLKTLPPEEMRSGFAEILKHGLIQNRDYWNKCTNLKGLFIEDLDDLIKESIEIKKNVVFQDPEEKGLRKTLNFGHTLGHAIESYFLENEKKKSLLHGEAVAAGMIMACYISRVMEGFAEDELVQVTQFVISVFGKIDIEPEDDPEIMNFLKFDKKNESGKTYFVLLKQIAVPVVQKFVPDEVIQQALEYYRSVQAE